MKTFPWSDAKKVRLLDRSNYFSSVVLPFVCVLAGAGASALTDDFVILPVLSPSSSVASLGGI